MFARPTILDLPTMEADDYLAWSLGQERGRYELWDGHIVAQASERAAHVRVKARVQRALEDATRAAGLPCEAFADGLAVRVSRRYVFEPDALLRCGPPLPGGAVEVTDPLVVVEVLSPSTRHVDAGKKLVGYFAVPSVRHYLLVDPDERTVTHHARDDIAVETAIVAPGDALLLDPPGLSLAVADLFPSPAA